MTPEPITPPAAAARKLITISIPVLNEEANVAPLMARVRAVAERLAQRYDFEFLFTDNDSADRTLAALTQESAADPRVRVLKLSRNYGFQRSILTNFLHARGAAAIQIDADMQDPPEMIEAFLDHWEKGYKVVYGVRRRRVEGAALLYARKLFYRFVDSITDFHVPVDAGDFRLIDRRIIEHLAALSDRNPYLRGVIASFGYPQVGIPYDRDARVAGASKFNLLKLVTLGIDGVTGQSTKPLQAITLAGFFLSGLTMVMGLAYVIAYFALDIGERSPGFMTLVLLQLTAMSVNAAILGVLGEYLGRVFDNVRGHPISIVEQVIENGRAAPPRAAETRPGVAETREDSRRAP